MIEATNLRVGYPGKTVLRDVDLTIPKGKVTVIVGPNGCGKSTLLKAICGMLPLQAGDIKLDGTSVGTLSSKLLAQRVSYLSQSRRVPDITVGRMVLHGRFPYLSYPRKYRKIDMEIARSAMTRMGVAELAETPVSELSGGQRQKVYLAMALAQDTHCVLLDEPTTYLDVAHQLQMGEHARFLCSQGKTVVMVLHDLPLALKTADHIVVMQDGRVAAVGTPGEILASGCMDTVFGVAVRSVQTPMGQQFYISGEKEESGCNLRQDPIKS